MTADATPAPGKPRYCLPAFEVALLEAKPNPLFTAAQTALVRFLRYYELGKPAKVACAHCGKKKTILWTQLCSFRVAEPMAFVLRRGDKVYPPLTPVCQTHMMAPEMEEVDEKGAPLHNSPPQKREKKRKP